MSSLVILNKFVISWRSFVKPVKLKKMSKQSTSPNPQGSRSSPKVDTAARIKFLEGVVGKDYSLPGMTTLEIFKIVASAVDEQQYNQLIHKMIEKTLTEADVRSIKTKTASASKSSSSSSSSSQEEVWEIIPTHAVCRRSFFPLLFPSHF